MYITCSVRACHVEMLRKCSRCCACDWHLCTLRISPQAARPALLVEISILCRAGSMTSAIALVVPAADELLPRAAVALGDDRVVELFGRDALEWLGIAWRWSRAHGRRAGGGDCVPFSPNPHSHTHPTDAVGVGKTGARKGEWGWRAVNTKSCSGKGDRLPSLETTSSGIASWNV